MKALDNFQDIKMFKKASPNARLDKTSKRGCSVFRPIQMKKPVRREAPPMPGPLGLFKHVEQCVPLCTWWEVSNTCFSL